MDHFEELEQLLDDGNIRRRFTNVFLATGQPTKTCHSFVKSVSIFGSGPNTPKKPISLAITPGLGLNSRLLSSKRGIDNSVPLSRFLRNRIVTP
jgi:hypothetical protein